MSFEQVQKLAQDNEIEWIDLRFTDVRGVQHHVTFPARVLEPGLSIPSSYCRFDRFTPYDRPRGRSG